MSSQSPADRFLRITTIVTFIPAIGFLIPYGVISREVCPALGLVPMALSAFYGIFCLWPGSIQAKALVFPIETFLAAFLLAILIPGWIAVASSWGWGDTGLTMVGTYGTVPLMVNFCIHICFALRRVYEICIEVSIFAPARCPECQCKLTARHPALPQYGPVPAEEGQLRYSDIDRVEKAQTVRATSSEVPRPSTDDESAPLM